MEISIHHISISVTDFEKSKDFYEKLGFKEKITWKSPGESLIISHLMLNDICLEIFKYENYQEMPQTAKELTTDLPRIGVKHFGLKVDSIEEMNEFLVEKGIIAEKQQINTGNTGVRYFFIKDPDEMLLEIVEDKRNL